LLFGHRQDAVMPSAHEQPEPVDGAGGDIVVIDPLGLGIV